jgi:hypothetical protein
MTSSISVTDTEQSEVPVVACAARSQSTTPTPATDNRPHDLARPNPESVCTTIGLARRRLGCRTRWACRHRIPHPRIFVSPLSPIAPMATVTVRRRRPYAARLAPPPPPPYPHDRYVGSEDADPSITRSGARVREETVREEDKRIGTHYSTRSDEPCAPPSLAACTSLPTPPPHPMIRTWETRPQTP